MGKKRNVVVNRLYELVTPTSKPRIPMAVSLSRYSGLSVEQVKDIAIEINKARRINSLPNYRMVSILLRLLPDEDIRYLLKLNREARYGNEQRTPDEMLAISIFRKRISEQFRQTRNKVFSELVKKHADLSIVPCEPILDELEDYFNDSEMIILKMVARGYNPKIEDTTNTISLLSAEHRQLMRENRKKERDRLLYEYERRSKTGSENRL
jgi:hypothetical protein